MAQAAPPCSVRFEHHTDTGPVLGLGTATPRLSWVVPDAEPGYEQTAYEVEVDRDAERTIYWVEGAEQVLVPWPARPFRSRERVTVRVRVHHDHDRSEWSEPATAEAGLLENTDWTAQFVSPVGVGGLDTPAPVLSTQFDVVGPVARARLYMTAHGVYTANLNGARVGDQVLAPGWTSYHHRLRYQSYDVTSQIHQGENRLEVLLGNGWYRGHLGYRGDRAVYGDRLALLAQLEITAADGTVTTVATDDTWAARQSETVADDLYDGQRIDLRKRKDPNSCFTGTVEVVAHDFHRLVAPEGPPVRVTEVRPAQKVWRSPSGRTLVDFGQNVVGWVRLRVRDLQRGTEVVVRHAEVLENDELGTRPLRGARATDSYLVAGDREEVLEPELTFHGFRYAEVSCAGDLAEADLEAVVVGSDLRRTGWFASSEPLVNQLHENVVWGMRGNFLDVPTDCPQRDERLGWTGDLQIFAPTATYLFDTAGFLRSWLADLAAEQLPDGSVPHVVPAFAHTAFDAVPTAAWGDAAVIVPWVLYQRTGDIEVLARQLPSMRAWVDKIAALAGSERLWTGGFQYGDWLDPTAPPENPGKAVTDPDVVASAHLARSAELLARAEAALGHRDAAARYGRLADEARAAFAHTYVTPAGRMTSDTQTAYAMALQWGLLPEAAQREEAGRRLADLVRAGGFRIATGFVGTAIICDALTDSGHGDVAHRLLLQTECPSWLYPVTMGATTVWERWDSMRPDGSINPGEMTSFNHYALGAVADWLHRSVAGLAPAAPGYRSIRVQPMLDGPMEWSSARHLTPYGDAAVSWRRDGRTVHLDVEVPVGATAEVVVPGSGHSETVAHGRHHWDAEIPEHEPSPTPTVRDIVDDPESWDTVVEIANHRNLVTRGAVEVAERLGRDFDSPAASILTALQIDAADPAAGDLQARLPALREAFHDEMPTGDAP
jgi:alpha-L-rhamnosidase